MTKLLLPLLLVATLSASADSFLYVFNGQSITNGDPVNVKALRARYGGAGSFFWFSIGGRSYIARDADVLKKMKVVYAPVFETGADFTIGEQFEVFQKQMAVLKEQLRIGLEPRPGEDARTAARRLELKYEQTRLGERQTDLAERANKGAERLNDYAARLDEINHNIELQLHDLGKELIERKIAVPVRD